jgi:pentatricopeptide repeat protein
VQEALHYLRNEVPPRSQTAPMYNSLLEAAQHSGKSKVAEQALQLMDEAGVAPNSRTVCAALRLLVGCPASPFFGLSLLHKWNQSAGCVAHMLKYVRRHKKSYCAVSCNDIATIHSCLLDAQEHSANQKQRCRTLLHRAAGGRRAQCTSTGPSSILHSSSM